MIRALVPNSMKNLILPDGSISRQLQLLFTALVSNSIPVTENASTGTPLAGVILLPDNALMPTGWQQVGTTVVLGGNTYKIITLV